MAAQTPGDPSGSIGTDAAGPQADPHRLLQILADTEATEENLAALQLHKSLTSRGWAVRTLALAPGKHAELAATIPVMSPTRRSLAAVSQMRTEQAWADLVLLRGMRTAGVARMAGTSPRRVLALWSEPSRWVQASRVSKFESHLLGAVETVVVNTQAEAVLLAGGPSGTGGAPSSVAVPNPAVANLAVPNVAVAGAHPSDSFYAASGRISDVIAAARQQLGIEPDQVAVRAIHGDLSRSGRARDEAIEQLRRAVASANEIARSSDASPSTEGHAPFAVLDGDDEASVLATDIAVLMGTFGGPSVAVLDAMATGSVVISASAYGGGKASEFELGEALVAAGSSTTELAETLVALATDPSRRLALSEAAVETIRDRFSPEIVVGRWLETLTAALPSRP